MQSRARGTNLQFLALCLSGLKRPQSDHATLELTSSAQSNAFDDQSTESKTLRTIRCSFPTVRP